jgi:hypothetical protein
MPERSKGRGQTKCTLWSSRLGVGLGANNSTPERSTVTKLPEPMEEDHGRGQDPHRVVPPVKKKKISCVWIGLNWLNVGFGGELL